MIYFDHNATTPLDERVLEAMLPYLQTQFGNPSGLYKLARIARSAIDNARAQLAALVDCLPEQIVFTSGGTEANTLAIANVGSGRMFISAIEHPSVYENALARHQPLTMLAVDQFGLLRLDTIKTQQLQAGDFVSIMQANNETGAIQDIETIAAYLADKKVILHTDAVQAVGKMPLSFRKSGVHMMSISSHKIYGPKGCGALLLTNPSQAKPILRGGNQEQNLRAGTENVAAIVGFGKAAELANQELAQRFNKMQQLKNRLEQQLLEIPGICIFAQAAPRLVNTIQFGSNNWRGDMLLMQLDRHNIAVSSGSACASQAAEISPVLTAMGIAPQLAHSAIRVSLGKDNNEQQVDQFVQLLKNNILTV